MDTKLTKTQDTVLNGIVRHILTALGGALVIKGTPAESELKIFFPSHVCGCAAVSAGYDAN